MYVRKMWTDFQSETIKFHLSLVCNSVAPVSLIENTTSEKRQ